MINDNHNHWMGKEDVGWKQEDVGASRYKLGCSVRRDRRWFLSNKGSIH